MGEDANALTLEEPGASSVRPSSLAFDARASFRATATAGAIAVTALLCFIPLSTNDYWLQAAIGRLIWTSGHIPATALFPFTEASGFPFQAHEWLCSVTVYLLDQGLGHEKMLFVKGLLGLVLFALACRLVHRLTGSLLASVVLALAAMIVANDRFWLRPELFALLFTVLELVLLVEYRLTAKRRYLLACIAVAIVWANSHASVPVALVIAASFAAGAALEARAAPGEGWRAARPYLACCVLMAAAILLNPYGIRVYRFAWNLETAQYLRADIFEWLPPFSQPFVGTRGFWAFTAYLALILGVVAARWRQVSVTGALLLLAFGALAFSANRHIAFFAFVALYPLSLMLAAPASRLERSPAAHAALTGALVFIAALVVRYGNLYGGFPYFVPSNNFSPMLVEYLAGTKLQGNVLNSYALGAELVYRAYPRLRPAIDSRVDVYGERYFSYVEHLTHDEAALRQFIERYDVRYLLLQWSDFEGGVRRMDGLRAAGWRILFADNKAVLLGRPEKN